jgi:hypothetical protein
LQKNDRSAAVSPAVRRASSPAAHVPSRYFWEPILAALLFLRPTSVAEFATPLLTFQGAVEFRQDQQQLAAIRRFDRRITELSPIPIVFS